MKKHENLPREFYTENRKRVLSSMPDYSAAVFFAGEAPHRTGDEFYVFTPNRSFLYLTGIDSPKIILLMVKTPDKTEEFLFAPRSDAVKEKWIGKALGADEAKTLSGVNTVLILDEFDDALKSALLLSHVETLYLDLDATRGFERSVPLQFYETFRKTRPGIALKDGGKIVEKLRGVKSDLEIEQIKNAIDITRVAFEHIISSIRPGMYEYQLESCFDFALKFNGVKEHAFNSIFAAGKNACVLHYSAKNCAVSDGELVLFDFGATCNYYCSDISRTVPVNGKYTERQKEIYNIVLEGQQTVIAAVKPGVTIFELNDLLIAYYKKALKKAGIINKGMRGAALNELLEKFYWHKIGHSLGLDCHDCAPKRDVPLEPGMVLTVEPGLYLEREGIGVRIEDDILVTANGSVNLSESIPKTVTEIEKAFDDAKARNSDD